MYLDILDEENAARVLGEALEYAPTQIVFNTIYNRLVDIQQRYNPQAYEPVREPTPWKEQPPIPSLPILMAPFEGVLSKPLSFKAVKASQPRLFLFNSTAYVIYEKDQVTRLFAS